jgi:hypothetical protein
LFAQLLDHSDVDAGSAGSSMGAGLVRDGVTAAGVPL